MKTVTILIPCYNEENSLTLLYERLQLVFQELKDYSIKILLVNDGSTDSTLIKMQELHTKDPSVS